MMLISLGPSSALIALERNLCLWRENPSTLHSLPQETVTLEGLALAASAIPLLPKTRVHTCYKIEHIPATPEVLHCHSSALLYQTMTNYRTSIAPEKGDACQETAFHRCFTPGCRNAQKDSQPCNPQLGRVARAARSPNSQHPDAGPSEAYCFLSPPSALGAEAPRSHRRGTTREPPGFTYISHCRSGRQWPPPGRPTLAFCADFLSAFPSQRG